MFSYRHAFHAGNHADVLKHTVLIQLLHYLNLKETPYTYIDTHAGAGLYRLEDAFAKKNKEFESGITRLWKRPSLPPALEQYVQFISTCNPDGVLRYYPGSPHCAHAIVRSSDKLRLYELHPTEGKNLAQHFRKLDTHATHQGIRLPKKQTMIYALDGFDGLKAQLPPPSRRGLILIDPSYEDKRDYRRVKEALADALIRFATGMYMVWYPLLNRMESRQMFSKLKQLPTQNWLHVTLTIRTPAPDGFGLHSSGLFIINPPHVLHTTLKETMPYLVQALGEDSNAGFTLETR